MRHLFRGARVLPRRRDLAERILKTGGGTMVADRLARRGLVVRGRDQSDRELVTVHLTDSGRAVIGRAHPLLAPSIAREMSVLGQEELTSLANLYGKLGLPEQPS